MNLKTHALLAAALCTVGTGAAVGQRTIDKTSPVIAEVLLADYAAAPYVALFRAPRFTFMNGDLVVIRGRNFGGRAADRSLQLRANGRDAPMIVSVWSDTLIRARVPAAQTVGPCVRGVSLPAPRLQRTDRPRRQGPRLDDEPAHSRSLRVESSAARGS